MVYKSPPPPFGTSQKKRPVCSNVREFYKLILDVTQEGKTFHPFGEIKGRWVVLLILYGFFINLRLTIEAAAPITKHIKRYVK